MNIINQYSYILLGLGLLGASWGFLRTYIHASRLVITSTMLIIIMLFSVGFVALRPGQSNVDSPTQAINTVGNGRPTLLFFFSNYCALCVTIDPLVDTLENEISSEFNVLRVDIHTPTGRIIRKTFSFSFTPEFVLFDDSGNEVWRDHILPGSADLNQA